MSQQAPGEHLACPQKAEEDQQSAELLIQTEAEKQKLIAEWQDLRGFLEEQEQLLLAQLEELTRAIVKRRDECICRQAREISLLGGKGQQPRSQSLQQGAGSTESSREDRPFQKPEPGFAELEKRLSDFSVKSAILQEVLLAFKGTLRLALWNNSGDETVCENQEDSPQQGAVQHMESSRMFSERCERSIHESQHRPERRRGNQPGNCWGNDKGVKETTAQQRIPTGERRNTCPESGKTFSSCSAFTAHQSIHVDETPYKCLMLKAVSIIYFTVVPQLFQ